MPPLLTPLILSAGASSRMGRPKALLPLGSRTALDRVLDTCAAAGLGPAIVVLGCDADAVSRGCDLSRATTVHNPDWARGMTSSVQRGLRALPTSAEGFLVWPVDLPLVSAAVVQELATRFWILRQNRREPIVVPKAERRGHPVLFDCAYRAELLALKPDEPPRTVLDRHPDQVEEIPAGEEVTRDLDTPDDYERARAGLDPLQG